MGRQDKKSAKADVFFKETKNTGNSSLYQRYVANITTGAISGFGPREKPSLKELAQYLNIRTQEYSPLEIISNRTESITVWSGESNSNQDLVFCRPLTSDEMRELYKHLYAPFRDY